MRRELATCAFLSLLVATVFSSDLAMGLLLLSVSAVLPWEAIFGAERVAGNVDETNVVGWRIRYADGTVAEGSTFTAWTLAASLDVVAVTFFLADQHDAYNTARQLVRQNYVNLFAHEANFWFVDGTTYGGGSELPPDLPLGAAKAGAASPTTDQEATDRLAIYNTALADRVWA